MKATAPRRRPALLQAAAALAIAVGVGLRCWTGSALWLDESLTVHLAQLPLDQLQGALRQDGAPPLYYLLLHGWVRVFGTGDIAARSLSELIGVLALPVVWLCGRRAGGSETAWAALLLTAGSPFAIRYATEARMYSLVLMLTAAGYLALSRALEQPTTGRLAGVTAVAAALLYTHYWGIFLLVVVAALLVVQHSRASWRCLVALAAAGVLFLPWLPTFLFQAAHTGAPWAEPAGYDAVLGALAEWAGGDTAQGRLLGLLLAGLAAAGVVGRRQPGPRGATRMVLEPPAQRPGAALLVATVGTLILGITAGLASGSAYAGRYSTVALLPLLLLAARGVTALPSSAVPATLLLAVACGLLSAAHNPGAQRTTAQKVAQAIDRQARPGDLVVYCPDQLGPAVSRYLQADLEQEVFPSGGRPERVDWVDYADRNRTADLAAFTRHVEQRVGGGQIWLVYATGYRTFGRSCQGLAESLSARRTQVVVVSTDRSVFEHPGLLRFGPSS